MTHEQNFVSKEIEEKAKMTIAIEEQKRETRNRYLMYAAAGIASICAIYCAVKLKKNAKDMRGAIARINAMTSVDVPQAIIDDAVANAANAQISRAVSSSVRRVESIVADETRKRVREAVEDNYDKIGGAVVTTLKKEVARISAEGLAEEVRKAAKKELMNKLENKFDDVVEDVTEAYTTNLDNVGKLYESMAKKILNNSN